MKTAHDLEGVKIEYHILQSFPVTCLNRDDVGAPKSAFIGGTPRARVSSQCWKRQVRMALRDLGVKIGVRTKDLRGMIADACRAAGATPDDAAACAEAVAASLADNTLFFFSESEAQAIAEFAAQNGFKPAALVKGDKKKAGLAHDLADLLKKRLNPAFDGLDIALFGRMAAQAPEMNMQAAASFAHAITTHKATNEVEFFTALDDRGEEPGSAHMGSLEFNSGTYYRYISLDLGQLAENLHGQELDKAIAAFTKALYMAVPQARQTTQAGMRPWDYALVVVRKGQGCQASFEKAVQSRDGFLEPSKVALNREVERMEKLGGSLYGKIDSYTFGEDTAFNIDALADALAQHVR